MRLQVDLVEQGPEGIWSKDHKGVKLEHYNPEVARERAWARLQEIAKHYSLEGCWHASVKLDGEHVAEIEL